LDRGNVTAAKREKIPRRGEGKPKENGERCNITRAGKKSQGGV